MNVSASASLTSAADAALSVEGVSHSYGKRQALRDVSLAVWPSEFVVLLGLNGAGKSTLFSIVTRLYVSKAGAVRIFGRDVVRESGAALADLGVVFQQRTLDLDLTVEQNLLYQAALHGLGGKRARLRGRHLMSRVGLADRADDRARHLSGGQMRRLEIARALMHAPRLILLDEPTAGLDIKARAGVQALVRELVASDRVAVLWTTHLVDEVRPEDRVIVLHKGRVLASATAAAISERAGAASIGEAFSKMTGAAGDEQEEA